MGGSRRSLARARGDALSDVVADHRCRDRLLPPPPPAPPPPPPAAPHPATSTRYSDEDAEEEEEEEEETAETELDDVMPQFKDGPDKGQPNPIQVSVSPESTHLNWNRR